MNTLNQAAFVIRLLVQHYHLNEIPHCSFICRMLFYSPVRDRFNEMSWCATSRNVGPFHNNIGKNSVDNQYILVSFIDYWFVDYH